MADPVFFTPTKDEWEKVATNVTTGKVHIFGGPGTYFHTYRNTGGAAPSNATRKTEGVPFDSDTEPIESAIGIDVYIYTDGENGRVRVDLI